MQKQRANAILDIIESNPAHDENGCPIGDLAEALGETVETTVRLVTAIEDDGDCLVSAVGPRRALWTVRSIRSHRNGADVRGDGDPDRRSDSQAVAEHQRDFYISIGPVDRLNPSCGYSVRVEEADSGLTTLFLTLKTLEDALIAARGATIELRP